jgi:glycosyltransferase involved in cell wall biosynthesis
MDSLSVVTPCFNEEENVERCIVETLTTIRAFSQNIHFEHIFIDNNSSDRTIEKLVALKARFPHIRILQNSQNVGAFSSIQRGLRAATSEWIVPFLAADCQDPPELIAQMIALRDKTNCDAVFGIRESRAEGVALLSMRKVFYFILRKLSKTGYKAGVSEFCLIQKSDALKIVQINDPNPFLRVYLNQLPGKVEYLPFHMNARTKGTSSANLFTLIDDALNAFSLVLPSVFSRTLVLSALLAFLGISISIYGVINNLFLQASTLPMITTGLILTVLSLLFALNSIIGHYVYIIHDQVRQKLTIDTKELEV